MELFKELEISLIKRELISIVGAGGKTSSMFKLANELLAHDKKVLVTTSTAIFKPNDGNYEKLILIENNKYENMKIQASNKGLTVLARTVSPKNKLLGADPKIIDQIFKSNIFDYIIVEADGANRKAIKAPKAHEPVIPSCTTKTIGVIGMDCVGKKLYEENAHRAQLLADISNMKLGDLIDENTIYNLIVSGEGIFKSVPEMSEKYIILNKSETEKRKKVAAKVKNMIEDNKVDIDKIIITSMRCR